VALPYPTEHWANDPDPESALRKASELGDSFNQTKWRLLCSLIPQDLTGLNVLDYGCGLGFTAVECAKRGASVTGIDVSQYALGTARFLASREGVLGRCRFLASENVVGSGYDLIVCKDVIEHLPDDDAWVSDVVGALNPGGKLICSTQNQFSITFLLEATYYRWWRGNTQWMGWDPTHLRFYTPGSLRRLLQQHDLKVIRWGSMYIIPYDIVIWLTLTKCQLQLNSLKYFDYLFGKMFPFNRLGFGLMVVAER
jgi:2-polyprenyl-6-hydroxyphenyl methylase/3-demethylubiquinone-9 3-methyltransferase